MITQLRKKFILTALLAVFGLLTVILLVINFVNFSLVSEDADRVLDHLVQQGGAFGDNWMPRDNGGQPNPGDPQQPQGMPNGIRPQPNAGPDSPELGRTTRYFTVSFDKDGNVLGAQVQMNAVNETQAVQWAQSLAGNKGGWTRTYYRYRVWTDGGTTYVTVIDYSRELLPSYRVLIASLVGVAVGMVVSLLALLGIARVVVKPIEQSDRRQRRFIADAATELKTPIAVIDANRHILEMRHGEQEETTAIATEVGRLTRLVQGLDNLLVLEGPRHDNMADLDLSQLVSEVATPYIDLFAGAGKRLSLFITPSVHYKGDAMRLGEMVGYCLDNALHYSTTQAKLSLQCTDQRITMVFANDADGVVDGPLDSVFERLYRSEDVRQSGIEGAGLSLSIVRQIVEIHHGRIWAMGDHGNFVLKIEL